MINMIDGALFQRMIIHGSASINAQKQAINDLNVFPVPDGDTGTNMSLTIVAAATRPALSMPLLCCEVPVVTPVLSCPCCSVESVRLSRSTILPTVSCLPMH